MDESPFQHPWDGQTVLNPVGAAAIIILGLMLLLLPRRKACIPLLIMACFVAPAQRINVFSLNFDLLRIMVLFGSVRVLMRGEWAGFRWRTLDLLVVAWGVVSIVACALLFRRFDFLKTVLGNVYDGVGMYFLFRMLVRDWEDLYYLAKASAIIAIPVAACFLFEHSTRRDPFAFFGGVPAITMVREGRLRCQGAFPHPILAGCFWAGFMPMFGALWLKARSYRRIALAGLASAFTIVVMCASSTPMMGVIFGLVAAAVFRVRGRLHQIRWTIAAALLVIQVFGHMPVWHLLARADILSGSTGWHRYHLVDEAVNHWREWWLIGTNQGTGHWGFGLEDVTNEYLSQALHGGLPLLTIFVGIIVVGFRDVGRSIRAAGADATAAAIAWSLGVCLFIHAMNFLGVSYFGQINMIWWLTLAVIVSLAGKPAIVRARPRMRVARASVRQSAVEEFVDVRGAGVRPV